MPINHRDMEGIPVCTCEIARADWFHQCTQCFRVVIARKPAMLAAALRAWPWLADQQVDWKFMEQERARRYP